MPKQILRIALVEDEECVRNALIRLVSSLGMRLEVFNSGREFLEHLREPLPDCLVLDMHMPGLNGPEVQSRIVGQGLRLPIIFISAAAGSAESRAVLNNGAVAILPKPFEDSDLLSAIRSATKRKRARRARFAPLAT